LKPADGQHTVEGLVPSGTLQAPMTVVAYFE
jgi:hypothetical protein